MAVDFVLGRARIFIDILRWPPKTLFRDDVGMNQNVHRAGDYRLAIPKVY